MADGVLKGGEELQSARAKPSTDKVLVVLTDGVATHPQKQGDPKYPEKFAITVGRNMKAQGINIFTIGLGKNINIEFLKSLASRADDFYLAPTAQDLKKIYSQIATKICKKKPAVIHVLPRVFPDASFIR